MSKISKPTEPSKYKISSSKSGSPLNSFKDFMSHDSGYTTEKEVNNLCQDLIEWAQREDAETFLGFYKFYGIPRTTFDNRVHAWPQLSKAKEIARDMIAERLQRKSFHKEYECDFKVVQPIMRMYHHEYQDAWKEEQELRKDDAPDKVIIQLEDFVRDRK